MLTTEWQRDRLLRRILTFVVVGGLWTLVPSRVLAQEPLGDALLSRVQSEAISFGVLFQFVGDFQVERTFPGSNGFSVANMRFNVGGRLDEGFYYFFQTNFGGILDARVGYEVTPAVAVEVGRFKAPFSSEFLTPASSIDFVNRAQVVSTLVPGREVGIQILSDLGSGLSFRGGVFNADGGLGGNNSGRFHSVARVSWSGDIGPEEGRSLEVGINAADNADAQQTGASVSSFDNMTSLLGVDVRWTAGRWFAAAEGIRGKALRDSTAAAAVGDPTGWHLSTGLMFRESLQGLVRLERFSPGDPDDSATLLVLGLNLWPTSLTELQINAIQPLSGLGSEPRLLVNIQLGF